MSFWIYAHNNSRKENLRDTKHEKIFSPRVKLVMITLPFQQLDNRICDQIKNNE